MPYERIAVEAPPNISVLIPAYKEEELLPGTLRRLRRSFRALGYSSYEVVVCDNNSRDGTAASARAGGASVVFEPHNQIARARNTAARHATGKWLIFVDADTRVGPRLLLRTIENLASGKVAGGGAWVRMVGPGSDVLSALLVLLWNALSAIAKLAPGAYVYCCRDAWVEIGGFREDLYASEEISFSIVQNAWARGHGLTCRIISDAPAVTSARRIAQLGWWRIAKQFLMLARPGSVRRPKNCALWYVRPEHE